MSHNSVAASVRRAKEKHPEDYCANPACLWRTQTRNGPKPCPKHPARSAGEALVKCFGCGVQLKPVEVHHYTLESDGWVACCGECFEHLQDERDKAEKAFQQGTDA